jgi:hypothetical protein
MSNLELIDDYLSNRLTGAEKEAFEKQLNNDPSLKSDLDFQRRIVEGIRTARAAELKSMLKNVPVGGTSVSMDFSVMKMAAGIIAAGVVGATIYFYVTRGETPPFDKAATDLNKTTEELKKPEIQPEDVTKVAPDSSREEAPVAAPEKESKKEPAAKKSKPQPEVKPAQKPKLEVTDPSAELESNENTRSESPAANLNRTDIKPSHIQVDIDSSSKKYDFHYQFAGGKLMLYGSFDKSLYEVLEINGDRHSVFLFYKNAYYLLDENQHNITKLEPITDKALISKLKEYRQG